MEPHNCQECLKLTTNKKFCSNSCATKFNNKIYPKRRPQGQCKHCQGSCKTSIKFCSTNCRTEYYAKQKERTRKNKIKYASKRVSEWRRRTKIRAVEYKGGKCENCKYDRCIQAMDFHHKDPSQKDFALASGNCKAWEKIQIELDKCVLLCANCHREEHARLRLDN